MLIGYKNQFAIESEITLIAPHRSQIALGFFVIYINGIQYGIRKPDATMLGCSFNEVRARCIRRNTHILPNLEAYDAFQIADDCYGSIYRDNPEPCLFLGIAKEPFYHLITANHLFWAPDGDEAFDNGSFVLQFDAGAQVRLIGFKSNGEGEVELDSLSDLCLEADLFYTLLEQWQSNFELEVLKRK